LNCGLHAVSAGKPCDRTVNVWTVRFSKPNTNRFSVFRTPLGSGIDSATWIEGHDDKEGHGKEKKRDWKHDSGDEIQFTPG